MKTFRTFLLLTGVGIALPTVLFVYHIFFSIPSGDVYPTEIRVEQGDSLGGVARKLRERRIISNGFLFSLWARVNGADKKIHPGLYRFEAGIPPYDILNRLVTGKGVFQSVTVPEGLTVKEIAELLHTMQIADKEKFLVEASNPLLLSALGLTDTGLEGYLFPSTYHFTPGTSEKDIILIMAEQFRKISLPLLKTGAREESMQLTPHEILTLASIIEKEAGIEAERPLVSAVFHNRLKRRMPLQSDPTVIYGLQQFDGNLTRKHLNEPTPFNTYRIAALPPGPICNPSVSSIQAALQPAQVSYLYFVSKNDGTHMFSETLEEHNRAVRTYQPMREPTSRRGSTSVKRRGRT